MDCADIPLAELGQMPWAPGGPRRPYMAFLEITQHCNNKCTHCYVDPANRPSTDLPLDWWLDLLDALVAEETLFLVLTGGEPLVRPDFEDLYVAAKQRGFILSVFTNARLVDDALLDLFHRYPPRRVLVSIYGATRETYEKIARVPGSFDQAIRGTRRLKEAGIPLYLRTMLLRSNHHELPQLQSLAAELGAQFNFDGAVCPTVEGDPCVLCERMDPEALVAIETQDPERVAGWRTSVEAYHPEVNRRRFNCAAGIYGLHITADGFAMPCPGAGTIRRPLERDDLRGSLHRFFFDEMLPTLHELDPDDSPCSRCRLSALCGTCSAARELETGSSRIPSEFGCRVAFLRAQAAGIDAVPAAYEEKNPEPLYGRGNK